MVEIIFRDDLVEDVDVSAVEDVILKAADDCLIGFDCHRGTAPITRGCA